MADDLTLKVDDIADVDRRLFKLGIDRAMACGDTSGHPLAPNGDDVYILGTPVEVGNFRRDGTHTEYASSVSFRNYIGTCEMLVKDAGRRHVIYTKINGLGRNELVDEYYREFLTVRDLVMGDITETFKEERDDMMAEHKKVWGF